MENIERGQLPKAIERTLAQHKYPIYVRFILSVFRVLYLWVDRIYWAQNSSVPAERGTAYFRYDDTIRNWSKHCSFIIANDFFFYGRNAVMWKISIPSQFLCLYYATHRTIFPETMCILWASVVHFHCSPPLPKCRVSCIQFFVFGWIAYTRSVVHRACRPGVLWFFLTHTHTTHTQCVTRSPHTQSIQESEWLYVCMFHSRIEFLRAFIMQCGWEHSLCALSVVRASLIAIAKNVYLDRETVMKEYMATPFFFFVLFCSFYLSFL